MAPKTVFHGDPSLEQQFWVIPKGEAIGNAMWNTHHNADEFCRNNEPAGDGAFKCKGHDYTGAGIMKDGGGYHGDPARENMYWVVESDDKVLHAQWNTTLPAEEFCNKHQAKKGFKTGLIGLKKCDDGFQCLGHEPHGKGKITKTEE